MDKGTSRFIAITLTEGEWQALRAIKPNPSAWLKQEINRTLEESGYSRSEADEDDDSPFVEARG
jgi:hypothetical protein